MGIEIESVKGISGGWSVAARPCDTCKCVAASVFCMADSAFLCITCDTRIHSLNKLVSARHERVWVCEVCEQAPAAVTCKADAAVLCVTCDADIHSANPLARRHERVPVEPFFDSAESAIAKCSASPLGFLGNLTTNASDYSGGATACQHEDLGGCSWLTQNDFNQKSKINMENTVDMKPADIFISDIDRFIDFEYQSSFQNTSSAGRDSVVPVQTKPDPVQFINNDENCFDIDFCRSKLSPFSYPTTHSLGQSVSSSSLDFGVVPDGGSSMSEISRAIGLNVSSATVTDPSSTVSSGAMNQSAAQQQVCGMDREARVSRYREKRKNRKFEKTIRYASRKAYAESRPRIKGRFAKRSEVENDVVVVGNMYASTTQYGIVPSF